MRETKKFKTKLGSEIEMFTYLTGGEARQIQDVLLGNIKLDMKGGEPDLTNIDPSVINKTQDKALELLIVSVNGNKENLFKQIMDLPNSETAEIIEKINEVQNPVTTEKKTK